MLRSGKGLRILAALAGMTGLAAAVSIVMAAQAKDKTSFREEVRSVYYGFLVLEYSSPATSEDLGLPFYPGAKSLRSWRYLALSKAEGSAKEKDGRLAGYLAQAFFSTSDAPKKVVAFYKARLLRLRSPRAEPLGARAGQVGKRVGLEPSSAGSETFLFSTLDKDTLTVRIFADPKSGQTQIQLNRASPTKAPLLVPPAERGPGEGLLI